jgi:cold shock CspA family protein
MSGIKRGKGDGKGKGFKAEKVDNPGLNYSEAIYTGTVKCPPLANTGYGFLVCEDLQAIYPGKDVFVHLKICPWAGPHDMNLQHGEQVQFNYFESNGAPQASRLVRPQ